MIKEELEKEAEEYAEKQIKHKMAKHDIFIKEEAKKEIMAVYLAGAKFGLKQHSHDYLVKTKNLKKKYEKQLEQAKKYLEECLYNVVSPERLRKDIEQFLKELAK